jgi:hypothetical protein
METKEPVILAVLVDAARLRWFVAAVHLDGTVVPLVRSEDGDLAICQGLGFDDQVSFLRHRFCGVLQRGCDRLWPVGQKACQFAFLFDGVLPGTTEELTRRVADHFVEWMLNPPVIVLTRNGEASTSGVHEPKPLAGTISPQLEEVLSTGLGPLTAAAADADAWEVSHRKGTWQSSHAG